MTEPQRPKRAGETRTTPRKMTQKRVENIARYYVERFATTAAHLRRVLQRRAERARRVHGDDPAETQTWIAQAVDKLVRAGAVDDARYAAARTASLRRLGRGPGKIRALLAAKGVPRALIEAAINDTSETIGGEDASFEAAMAFVKRRRFGAFGKPIGDKSEQAKKRARELAALARAGFSYTVAKRALAASNG
jgi:regulatory protein